MSDLKYNLSTDEKHVIELDSTLVYAEWSHGVAYAGQKARLEVGTTFVGNGATIKVKGKSEGGKKLGKISDKIACNKFVGELEIPGDIEPGDQIYFEVELPDNGISGESSRIPVRPIVRVSNMKWSAKDARRGDILTLTADISGLYSGTEVMVMIYEYDQNGAHDPITELPAEVKDDRIEVMWEYEYHEDTRKIATEDDFQKYDRKSHYAHPEYFFTVKIGDSEFGKDTASGLLLFKDWFEFRLTDTDGIPIPKAEYILHLADGTEKEGTLDDDGYAREEEISPGGIMVEFPKYKIVKKTM